MIYEWVGILASGTAPTIAVIAGNIIQSRAAARAEEAARRAHIAADDAARLLLVSKRATDQKLETIRQEGAARDGALDVLKKSADDNMAVTAETHSLVNGRLTMVLRSVEVLAKRIAAENPGDSAAQEAAMEASRAAIESAERAGER
jgi:hypothetical protein